MTRTLSWKTSVTLQVNGGVGLSEGKVSEAMPTIIFTHDVDVDVPFVAALGVADDHLGGNAQKFFRSCLFIFAVPCKPPISLSSG